MKKWTGPEDPAYAGCGEEGRRSFRLLRDLLSAAEPDPDSEDLSEWQLSRLTYVRSMSEWDTALRRLGPAVDEVPVVAVTCLGEPEPTELLISDYRYHIAVLRLTDLEATECPLEAEEKAVPRDLKRWLADPSVAIVASDEGIRLSRPPHCLTVTSVVSSDEVMRSQRKSGLIRDPDEDCGLQKQLSWAVGGWRTLSPIARDIETPWRHGDHQALYDWDYFFLAAGRIIFVEAVVLRGFRDGSVANLPPAGELGPTIREWLAHFTPVVRPPLGADARGLEGKDSRTRNREESNSARAEPRRESSSRGQTLASFARNTWSGVSDRDLSKETFKISISGGGRVQAARALASAEADGRHVSIRADRNVAMQMQLDRAKSATVAVAPLYKERAEVLDAERRMKAMATEKAKKLNPYLSTPRFLEICDYCGGDICRVINCPKLKSAVPRRRVCEYVRCPNPSGHLTQVCPSLHSRCHKCGCRGHGEKDRCDVGDEEVSWRLRSDFERFADSGVYTRMRRDDVRWGWYPPLRNPWCERYVSYGSLSTRPARESLSYIRALSEI